MIQNKDLIEVFRTSAGCVYQSNKDNKILIEFAGNTTTLTIPCFFCLKKMVDKIDINAMVSDPSPSADVEIISPCGCERCFVLTVYDVLAFSELLSGTRAMLELNSILYERLYSIPV